MNKQNEEEQIDKAERQVEQAGKDATRKAGNAIEKLAKKGIKLLIHAIGLKTFIIVLIAIILFMSIAVIWYGMKDKVFNSISDIIKSITNDNSGNITKITEINGRQFEIDKEELDERIDKWFKANKVSKQQIGLGEDLSGLDYFLEAEIVTSYPDLRQRSQIGTPVANGEIQGCVQFHRRMLDGTTIVLEYMPYKDFSLELAKIGILLDENQTQEQIYFDKLDIERVYNNLENKFTLDENDNLIIINMVTTQKQVYYSNYAKEEGYNDEDEYIFDIEPTIVNYQNVIQKYTMPFEFCLALLMTTENYEFCKAVADLAKESKIVINIQDNVTTNVTTEVYSFDVDFEMERYIKYYTETKTSSSSYAAIGDRYTKSDTMEYSPYPITGEANFNVEPYKTTVNTLKNNEIKLCVTQAKTWIADYNSEYTNIEKNPKIDDIISEEPDDASFSEVPDYHNLLSRLKYNLPSSENVRSYIVEDKGIVKERKYNKKTVISTKVTANEYSKSSSEVEETPERFLSLLQVDPNTGIFDVENLKNNSKLIQYKNINKEEKSSPEDNLISGRYILYKFLASNSKTVSLEDTMRYLINVYRGKVTAKKSEDFEIYEPEEFVFIDGAWNALWKNNYTKEQFIQMVKSYIPPNGTGNGGRSFIEYYEKHFILNAENYFDIATSYGLDPMFIFCIGIHESQYGTSNISYDKGNFWGWGAYDSSPYQSAVSFVGDASKGIESICKGIANNYVSSTGAWYNWIQERGYNPETIEGIGARYASDSSWASIVKKHMTTIFGISGQLTGSQIELVGDSQNKIVQWAELQIGKTSFYNKARGGNCVSKSYCAAFVKSAYNEAGLGYINGNAIDIPHSNPIQYNSTGQVDYSNIPIGACIVSKGSSSYGHVALYVGNGYVIEAGGRTIVKQKIDQSYGKKYGFLGWGYATVSQTI